MAVAIKGPIPGTVMSRRATSSVFARAVISRSRAVTSSCNRRSISTRRARHERAASGMPEAGSSINEPCDVRGTLRSDHAVLGEVPAQGIDDLGALADEQIAGPEDHSRCLLGLALDGHEGDRTLRSIEVSPGPGAGAALNAMA